MTRRTLAVDMEALEDGWAQDPELIESGEWTLVKAYPGENQNQTGLFDLSHRPKAVVVGPAAEAVAPPVPGRAVWDGERIVCCRKPGERIVFDLAGPLEPSWPDRHYTDLTDGWVLLALAGPEAVTIMERMIPIDFERPQIEGPIYFVTRSHGIWVQVVNLKTDPSGFLLACDRSLGRHLTLALVRAGCPYGLQPRGLEGLAGLVESLEKNRG